MKIAIGADSAGKPLLDAERAMKSNNAQTITMGARVIGPEVAKSIVDVWLASEFDPAGSSAENVKAIDKLDSAKANPS
jgi:D-erythrulose 4-phosphate isomerase